jgi:hypothetical protein
MISMSLTGTETRRSLGQAYVMRRRRADFNLPVDVCIEFDAGAALK